MIENLNVKLDSIPYMEKIVFNSEEETKEAYESVLPFLYSKRYVVYRGKNYLMKMKK